MKNKIAILLACLFLAFGGNLQAQTTPAQTPAAKAKADKAAATKADKTKAKADKTTAKTKTVASTATTTPAARTVAKSTPATVSKSKPEVNPVNKSADKAIGTDAKGRTIYQGPKGGKYTLTAAGNKEYIKQ